MNRTGIVNRVRSYTRDFSASIFRYADITDYINEGIDRIKSRVPELQAMSYLDSDSESPELLPSQYHYLLAVFSSSRCFAQDERFYQASTLMNEFEQKLDELIASIGEGSVVIKDANGASVSTVYPDDAVNDVYFDTDSEENDIDNGVDGVVS